MGEGHPLSTCTSKSVSSDIIIETKIFIKCYLNALEIIHYDSHDPTLISKNLLFSYLFLLQ